MGVKIFSLDSIRLCTEVLDSCVYHTLPLICIAENVILYVVQNVIISITVGVIVEHTSKQRPTICSSWHLEVSYTKG